MFGVYKYVTVSDPDQLTSLVLLQVASTALVHELVGVKVAISVTRPTVPVPTNGVKDVVIIAGLGVKAPTPSVGGTRPLLHVNGNVKLF